MGHYFLDTHNLSQHHSIHTGSIFQEGMCCSIEIEGQKGKDNGLKHYLGVWQHSPFSDFVPLKYKFVPVNYETIIHQRCQLDYIYSNASLHFYLHSVVCIFFGSPSGDNPDLVPGVIYSFNLILLYRNDLKEKLYIAKYYVQIVIL